MISEKPAMKSANVLGHLPISPSAPSCDICCLCPHNVQHPKRRGLDRKCPRTFADLNFGFSENRQHSLSELPRPCCLMILLFTVFPICTANLEPALAGMTARVRLAAHAFCSCNHALTLGARFKAAQNLGQIENWNPHHPDFMIDVKP